MHAVLFDKIEVLYTNADCLSNKRTELLLLLNSFENKPNVIVITEVNPKVSVSNLQESECNILGYNMFCKNISKDKARGIIIYVDNRFIALEIEIASLFSEYLFVQIKTATRQVITIGAFYRSPSSSRDNDMSMLNLICDINKKCTGKLVLMGDFNFPGIDWNSWTSSSGSNFDSVENKFISCLQENFLLQHVVFHTRARGTQSPHTLDLIISNDNFVSDVYNMSPLGKSDHSVIHCTCNLSFICEHVNKFNYIKGNYDALRHNVSDFLNNDSVLSDEVNDAWNYFNNVISSACKSCIPIAASNSWKRKASWQHQISGEARKLIRKKHRLWTRFQETKSLNIETEYKKIRNLVRQESRNLQRKTQLDVAKTCKENPKKFWKYVNFKTKTHTAIGNILETDPLGITRVIECDLDKANAFANYFVNVYSHDPPIDPAQLMTVLPQNSMSQLTFSHKVVEKKLHDLKVNKSPGPDMMHPKVLFELRGIISGNLSNIFQMSLEQGRIPEDWKCSNVTVIHKKGRKDYVENYRPISLTCVACKVMESIVKDHIMQYFIDNKLFSSFQYGFLKGRSTMLQLLKVMDDWTSCLDKGGQIDIVYTDFEKAFDKVSHKLLLSKMLSYGISKELIIWIEAFLCHRTQRVKINNAFSSSKPVLSGIPQGSVLGPMLFVIFINDLPKVCDQLCKIFLFADDSKIYKHITNNNDYLCLKEGCQKVFDWSRQWNMSLNIGKCKVLSLTKMRNTSQKLDYGFELDSHKFITLDHVEDMKDLGVIIDCQLTFWQHINEKINKAYQMLGIIKRNFRDMDKDTFLLLYKCLVRSHLEYANSVWNPYKNYQISALERVQKRATKLIGVCKNLHYNERLRFLKLPTLNFRRVRGDMIEVYKILSGMYDTLSVPTLFRNLDSRTRGNSLKLKHMHSKYDVRKYSFCSRTVGVWNALPDYVVTSENINSFKNNLDKHWKSEEMRFNWEANLAGCTI